MTQNGIKWLCALYTCYYFDSIYNLCHPKLTAAKDYLTFKSKISEKDVKKFLKIYNDWISYDMTVKNEQYESNVLPYISPEDFIWTHWNDDIIN